MKGRELEELETLKVGSHPNVHTDLADLYWKTPPSARPRFKGIFKGILSFLNNSKCGKNTSDVLEKWGLFAFPHPSCNYRLEMLKRCKKAFYVN